MIKSVNDGAGHYCRLFPMRHDEEYPHEFWRMMCFGNKGCMDCEKKVNRDFKTIREAGEPAKIYFT